MTSNNLADGLFDKRDFAYDDKNDEYRCPAGRIAIYTGSPQKKVARPNTNTGRQPARSAQ